MQFMIILVFMVVGYFIGSLSIARLVVHFVSPDVNLEQVEAPDQTTGGTFTMRFVGATTASMVLGPKVGGLIGILDILKGAIPTLVVRLIFPDQPYFFILGTAIVLGHIWPIYFGFRGGVGLSSALGVLLILDPLGTLVCILLGMLIGMFILKEIGFILMGGPMLFLFWIAFRTGDWLYIGLTLLINFSLIIALIPDYRYQIEARKAGKSDLGSSMDGFPMGQMMKKMMIKMGISPDKKRTK
jgi:acyl phosphate:glycerol-3-phosphate acyltransferase